MMKEFRRNSLASKVQARINALPSSVILRADVEKLGGYRQVSRAISALEAKGQLVRIGYGVYAKARPSSLSAQPIIQGGFDSAAKEALNRLNIKWQPGKATLDYNSGRSTQVPVQTSVKLQSRFRRRIAWRKMQMKYE